MVRRTRAEMEETRATLLATARRVFSEHGYAATSMDDLTAQAGLTRGALYHHFGDKKGLLAAVVAQLDAETDVRLQAIDRLRRCCRRSAPGSSRAGRTSSPRCPRHRWRHARSRRWRTPRRPPSP